MTTPTDPMQGNRIIAEFMGAECLEDGFYRMEPPPLWFENREVADYHIENMLYHIRWDWLMPVVQRIETIDDYMFTVSIHKSSCAILMNGKSEINPTINHKGVNKLQVTYRAVLEFINWYNSTHNGTANE